MDKNQIKKFVILLAVFILVFGSISISELVNNHFSIQSIKTAINIFIPFVSGFGCGLYYLIIRDVSATDTIGKLVGSLISMSIIIVTFEIIKLLLGTNIQLFK